MTDCCPFGTPETHEHETPTREERDWLDEVLKDAALSWWGLTPN